jgi:hypothetical protein
MSVRCAKCGEELLGAVNRCWKCGQKFDLRPEIDGRPPVRFEMTEAATEPVEAVLLDEPPAEPSTGDGAAQAAATPATVETSYYPPAPAWTSAATKTPTPAIPRSIPRSVVNASDIVEARRKSAMAMGGTVAAIVLGLFAIAIAPFRFEAAFIALIGVIMGIWGLYSPRRNWALAAMLLCCLAVGLGAFTGARQILLWLESQKEIQMVEPVDPNAAQ